MSPHGWAREGTTVADIAPQAAALGAFAAGFALLGVLLFKFER